MKYCFWWPVFALLVVLQSSALAWGPGHRDIADQVFQNLPQDIQSLIPDDARKNAIQTYALYPDSFNPFLSNEIGDAAIAKLQANGIKNRYGLHSDKGRALAFVLLAQAFKDHRYDYAAVWIAALSHSTSDMAAINHDPLVHWMIYTSTYKLKLPDVGPASVLRVFEVHSLVAEDGPEGQAIWSKAIASHLLKDDGRDPTTAIVDIMSYGNEGADYCAKRGLSIVANAIKAVTQHDNDARKLAETTLGDLGGWAVGRTVRDVIVAYRFAKDNTPVDLTPDVLHQFSQKNDKFMHDRQIADDELFAPILKPLQPGHNVQVGVVLEPDWRMNDAMLGYTDRIIAASACRSLAHANREYATLDVRDLLTGAAPDPKQVPTLLISGSALRSYEWMHVADLNQKLKTYLGAGGNIIWIGGDALPPDALGAIRSAASRVEKQSVPITELLKDDDALHGTNLVLMAGDEQSWPFVRPPVTPAGWTQPLCPWKFINPPAELTPLVQLQSGSENTTVGVLWTPAGAKSPRAAFLPIYSVAPMLLVKDNIIPHPTEPELDEPAQAIVFRTLDRLAGR